MKKFAMPGIAGALILALVLMLGVPAMAASTQVRVTGKVNVRSGPGTNYTKLGQLQKDAIVTSTGTTGDWTEIEYQDGTAYISSIYVASVSGTSTSGSTTSTGQAQATADVNVRSGSGTNYTKLGQLKKGETVPYNGTSNGWAEIEFLDGTAYVNSQYIKVISSVSGGVTVSATGQMKATGNVNIRSGPGTNYKKLGQLKKGATIESTGTSNGWVSVVYNGQTAYISRDFLQEVTTNVISVTPTPTPSSGTSGSKVYAIRATTVRSGAGTQYKAIGYLDVGDSLTYLGTSGLWYTVQLGSSTGYVYASDMQMSDPSGTSMTTVNAMRYALNDNTVYYSTTTASTTYRLGVLEKGEYVYVLAVNTIWAKCTYGSSTVYIQVNQLSGSMGSDGMTTVNEYRYTLYDNVGYYSTMNTSSQYLLGLLNKNAMIYVLEASSSWAKCTYGSSTVYIPASQLTAGSGTTSGMTAVNATWYIKYDNVGYYSTTSTSSQYILGRLSQNTAVYVLEAGSSWVKCTYGSSTVYIQATDIAGTGSDASFTTLNQYRYAKTDKVKCYRSPSTAAYVDGYLDKYEKFYVRSTNGTWAEGTVEGVNKTLYVLMSDLMS